MYGHPHNQILATIIVEEKVTYGPPTLPIEEMIFTPGYTEEESIQAEDIVASETIVFSMGADRDRAPFPQYYINGKSFSGNRLDFFAHPGESREYLLINANHNVHPFHIHVNRFQVKEMGSELSTEKYPVLAHVMAFDPFDWRDTVVVPPNGRARIWIHYKNYTGKTVMHCHFLAHEDTGMMATLFIGHPDYIFRFKDHASLILGLIIGGLATSMLLLSYFRSINNREAYSQVAMNELKSKAQD
jgi:FtsP/CotA-like multicopper oxidase with cupredoxin domain